MEFKLDKGVGYMYCYNPSHPLANKAGKVYEHLCDFCKKPFITTEARAQIFCSQECRGRSTRKFEISKDTLGELLWKYPTTQISKMLGVSDKAIEKRAKKLGLSKPPRGYWAKLSAGNI